MGSRDDRSFLLFSYVIALLAAFIGSLVILGWLLGIKALTSVLPGLATMKPNTALCFVMAGISLWLIQFRSGDVVRQPLQSVYAARGLSAIVAFIGLLTFAECLLHLDLGIDEALFTKSLLGSAALHPGRMASATAFGFLLLGSGLLWTTSRFAYPAQIFGLLTALNGFVAAIGYLLGAKALYSIPSYSSMALHTAILFLMMGLAVVASRPRMGIMSIVTSPYLGGVMVRRVLPLTVMIVLLLGWLRWRGQVSGLYGTEFGLTLLIVSEIAVFALLLGFNGLRLNRLDQERRVAQVQRLQVATAVQASNDAIFNKDLFGTITTWNRGAERLYGYRAEEIIGKAVAILIPKDLQEEASQFLQDIARGQLVTREETVRLRKDGSLVPVSIVISPVLDLDGRVVGASTIANDISERLRTEKALRESQERLTGIIGSAMDSIITVDEQQRIVLFNAAAERMFRCTEANALGQSIDRFIPERFRSTHGAYIQEFGQTGVTNRSMGALGSLWAVRADGEEFQIEASISQIESGGKKLFTVILRDVTERRQAEQLLRRSEENYRTLFDSMEEGFCTIQVLFNEADKAVDYRFLEVNPAFVRQTGILDARGKTMREIAPRHEEHWFQIYGKVALTGEAIRFENVAEQLHRWYEVYAFRVGEPKERRVAIFFSDITKRKRAEVEIAESQQALEDKTRLLQSVLDSMSEGLVVADEQGKFLVWNPAAEKIVGLGPANMASQDWTEHYGLFLPDKVTPFPAEFNPLSRAIQGLAGTAVMFLRHPKVADGVFIEAYASPLRDKHGVLRGGVTAFRDITERIAAEERLREYERVVEGLEEMIVVVDRQYRYVIANKAFLNFRDVSGEQVVGHFVYDVVGQETFAALVKEKMDECFLGKVVEYEMAYHFPNMGRRDLWVSYFPIDGPTGVERIACVLQDITERKMAEEALRKSEERFSKAFRNSPLAITISTEAEGRYLDVNEAFLLMLERDRQEVIGHTAADVAFWAEPLERLEMLSQLRAGERVAKLQMQFKTAKGEIREAEVWAEPIELDKQPCVLGIVRDVTEVKRLEAQFRQAQKMEAVGRLAGGVAHDFNNILGIILGYSDLALTKEPPGPLDRYLSEIKKASQRAALLTRQLLAFSRQQVVFPKVLDLNDVVHNVNSMFLRLVGEDIEIEFRPTTPLSSIKADPGQIEQILMNLVVNARDAMPSGGKILIETAHADLDEYYASQHPGAHAGHHVVLIVSDTGCGMNEKIKAQIFEPFFTTKAVGQGTGLGLSTVYGIVKQSEGYILVYSEPGRGTTFKIYFPRVSDKAEEVGSRIETEPPRGWETILAVEDDPTLRELMTRLLREAGYQVLEAEDGDGAMSILETYKDEIHLLLTDVVMPGKSGVELLKLARVARPNLRSLFMSGYTGDLVALHGVVTKEGSFLEKPFTRASLLTKVHSVLHDESRQDESRKE